MTLYIDVYFLINFTVDLLALYFASVFTKIFSSVPRLILSACIGASYAVIGIILIEDKTLMLPLSALFLFLMIVITTKGVGIYRRIKYSVAFLLFQIIIGGLVYYGYCTLDSLIGSFNFEQVGEENRNLIILALLFLLSIGVLKLVISFFGNIKSERCVKLLICYENNEYTVEAFVDSGNLAQDPFDKTPVMLVNASVAEKIFGKLDLYASEDYKVRKKIRVIPVSFGGNKRILYGIKPDCVYAVSGKKKEKISIIIAIDNEGENYGGYSALMPLLALEDINYADN